MDPLKPSCKHHRSKRSSWQYGSLVSLQSLNVQCQYIQVNQAKKTHADESDEHIQSSRNSLHELSDQESTLKEAARAKLRVIVKRLLKKYGYPPDMALLATETVLEQAEQLAEELANAA